MALHPRDLRHDGYVAGKRRHLKITHLPTGKFVEPLHEGEPVFDMLARLDDMVNGDKAAPRPV